MVLDVDERLDPETIELIQNNYDLLEDNDFDYNEILPDGSEQRGVGSNPRLFFVD